MRTEHRDRANLESPKGIRAKRRAGQGVRTACPLPRQHCPTVKRAPDHTRAHICQSALRLCGFNVAHSIGPTCIHNEINGLLRF